MASYHHVWWRCLEFGIGGGEVCGVNYIGSDCWWCLVIVSPRDWLDRAFRWTCSTTGPDPPMKTPQKNHLRQIPRGLVGEGEPPHGLVEPPALAPLRLDDEDLHGVGVRREALGALGGQVGVGACCGFGVVMV